MAIAILVGLARLVSLADLGRNAGLGCNIGCLRIAGLPLIRFHLRDHRIQRLHRQPALLDGYPPAEHHRLVVLFKAAEAFFSPYFCLYRRGVLPLAAPPVHPHQPLHVSGGAVAGDVQQLRLVLRSGRTGHRTHFGEADLALLERSVDQGQLPQRTGHANLLAGHQVAEPAFPVQPVGQRTDPGPGPALLPVELFKELEEPVLGGIEVTGQGGDLIGEQVRAFFPRIRRSGIRRPGIRRPGTRRPGLEKLGRETLGCDRPGRRLFGCEWRGGGLGEVGCRGNGGIEHGSSEGGERSNQYCLYNQ